MATYPTGVYAPTDRANGQTITDVWFDEPSNEIVAIESALINGIPHAITISTGGLTVSTGSVNIGGPSTITTLQAGASTLASLQVNGASTFSGAVTFSSGVTFAGGAQTFSGLLTASSGVAVSTGLVRQNSLPAWNVWSSVVNTRTAGSTSGVNFTTQDYLQGTVEHSTSANSSRVHVASTGLYTMTIHAGVSATGNIAGRGDLMIWLNDTTALIVANVSGTPSTGPITAQTITATFDRRITSSGYLTVTAGAVGGDQDIVFGSTSHLTGIRFSGRFLG